MKGGEKTYFRKKVHTPGLQGTKGAEGTGGPTKKTQKRRKKGGKVRGTRMQSVEPTYPIRKRRKGATLGGSKSGLQK